MVDELNTDQNVPVDQSTIDNLVSNSGGSQSDSDLIHLTEPSSIGYSKLIKDLLLGTSAKDLRRNRQLFKYQISNFVIDQIGGKADHLRGNHSLLDRLENTQTVIEELFFDYGISLDGDVNNYTISKNNVDSALSELNLLEQELKSFDVSNSRLRKVKNADLVRESRASMLNKIQLAKQNIAKKYDLAIIEQDQTSLLINDILAGKSAKYLQNNYATFEITRNHAWRDRINNARNLLYSELNFNPANDDYFLTSTPSNNSSDQINNLLNEMQSALEKLVPKKYQTFNPSRKKFASACSNRVLYNLTINELDQVRSELVFAQNQMQGIFNRRASSTNIKKIDPVNVFPFRYSGYGVNVGGWHPTKILDIRKESEFKIYFSQFVDPVSNSQGLPKYSAISEEQRILRRSQSQLKLAYQRLDGPENLELAKIIDMPYDLSFAFKKDFDKAIFDEESYQSDDENFNDFFVDRKNHVTSIKASHPSRGNFLDKIIDYFSIFSN